MESRRDRGIEEGDGRAVSSRMRGRAATRLIEKLTRRRGVAENQRVVLLGESARHSGQV